MTFITRVLVSLCLITLLVGLGVGNNQVTASGQAGVGHRISKSIPTSQTGLVGSGSNSAVTYYNWSGYAANNSGQFNKVTMTYTQPTVTCPVANAWTLFWVGFDGFDNGTVEQAGTQAICGAAGSQPTYLAWWEMYPTYNIQSMPMTVKPGNTITTTVTYNKTGSYTMTVSNVSTRQSNSQTYACATNLICARDSADWIVERPTVNGAYAPLADWNTMQLNNAQASNTVSKKNVPVLRPVSAFTNTPIYMVNDPYTGEILAKVGILNTSGNSFIDSWLNSQ